MIKINNMVKGLGNRLKKFLPGENGDDGVVDLKESAFPLRTYPQRLFGLPPLRYVFGKSHDESLHAFSARNERNVVAYPPQGAILASILLLDLKLLSFSLQQLVDQ